MGKFIKKFKKFITTAGFTKLLYLILFITLWTMGYNILAGAALGIFVYINFNVLTKVIQDGLDKI